MSLCNDPVLLSLMEITSMWAPLHGFLGEKLVDFAKTTFDGLFTSSHSNLITYTSINWFVEIHLTAFLTIFVYWLHLKTLPKFSLRSSNLLSMGVICELCNTEAAAVDNVEIAIDQQMIDLASRETSSYADDMPTFESTLIYNVRDGASQRRRYWFDFIHVRR